LSFLLEKPDVYFSLAFALRNEYSRGAMNFDQINAEQEAVQSLMELYAQSRKCQQLYERAGLTIPEALQRILGMNGNSQKATGHARTAPSIPAPTRPNEPVGAEPDWIWINIEDATPTSVVLAILRASKEPLRHKDVVDRVIKLLPTARIGSIGNIGTRLEGKLIERTADGWRLLDQTKAGIITDDLLWGSPSMFNKQELAAHRRDAIVHLLTHYKTGLQTVQIVEELHNCSWVQAPVNKDLLKADLEILRTKGKIKRGSSKKWGITSKEMEK
jgi:hypothetical protein